MGGTQREEACLELVKGLVIRWCFAMTSEQKGGDVPAYWPWLGLLGSLVSDAKDRDSSSADQAARINATHSELFDVLVKREKQVAELIEAATRANGDHNAPDDCYATGPLTGDHIRDLVECPGCVLAATLTALRGQP